MTILILCISKNNASPFAVPVLLWRFKQLYLHCFNSYSSSQVYLLHFFVYLNTVCELYHKVRICFPVITAVILVDTDGVACGCFPHLKYKQQPHISPLKKTKQKTEISNTYFRHTCFSMFKRKDNIVLNSTRNVYAREKYYLFLCICQEMQIRRNKYLHIRLDG